MLLLAEASIPSDSVKNATGEARLGVYFGNRFNLETLS